MRFNSLLNGAQAQIDLTRADYPDVEYLQLMITSLVYYPYELQEKNFLILGLGGGILARAIRKLYPMSSIDIVEIDPLVNEIAKKYFNFREDSKMKVFLTDGRAFLKQCSNRAHYDIIFYDAYDAVCGFPTHMKTKEFFTELKSSLSSNGGLLILNLVCIYQSYVNIRRTIGHVFDQYDLVTFRSSDFVNIVAVASSSIERFPIVNRQTNVINDIQQILSIHVCSLLNNQQQEVTADSTSSAIYTDGAIDNDDEQFMSMEQFVNTV